MNEVWHARSGICPAWLRARSNPVLTARIWPKARGSAWKRCPTRAHGKGGSTRWPAEWRNRIEATFGEITDRMELARHGAHTFWGPASPHRSDHRRTHPPARMHG